MSGTSQRAGALALAGVALVVAVVLAVGTWAASGPPDEIVRGDGFTIERLSTPPSEPTAQTSDVAAEDGATFDVPAVPPRWGRIVGRVLGILALGLVVGVIALLGLRAARGFRRGERATRAGPDSDLGDVVGPAPERIAASMADDAAHQLALLAEGDPRNAIVQAWHHFEVQAERAGVPRAVWETSTEFTRRLLTTVEADRDAVDRLAGLYRVARFSEHPVTEADRAAARAALDVVHDRLRARAAADVGRPS